MSDWNNPTQVQHCELEKLLATERKDVQNTLANYLASLLTLGTDGLRIDAAKHLSPQELHTILEKAPASIMWDPVLYWSSRNTSVAHLIEMALMEMVR